MSAQASYTLCASLVSDPHLQTSLLAVTPEVTAAEARYDLAARTAKTHTLDPVDFNLTGVSKEQMYGMYDRLLDPTRAGRVVYETLKDSSFICPYCGHRDVNSLDHFMPKSQFPALAVTPSNLVPACFACNKSKLATVASAEEDVLLHPYYENVDNHEWLQAQVQVGSPAFFTYDVAAAAHWNPTLAARVENHFLRLGLAPLFSSQAATRLATIRGRLTGLFAKGGSADVEFHLKEEYSSCRDERLNAWDTALYKAMSTSAWFCNGGFR